MKQNRVWLHALTVSLLLSLTLSAVGCQSPADDTPETTAKIEETTAATGDTTDTEKATDPVTAPTTEPETEPPFVGLTLDATTRIVIPADADEITRNAADLMSATIAEKTGMTLAVVSADEDGAANGATLALSVRSFESERSYAVTAEDQTLRLEASDSTTLYFAAEAVLEAWLTPDFGLSADGSLSLAEARVAELNGLPTRLNTSVRVLSQNVRVADDPNGNSVAERANRLLALLKEYRPDLIGTQETSDTWMIHFKKIVKKLNVNTDLGEYGTVGCSREGRESKTGEWNTILYRKDRFELLDSDTTWLSYTPNEASAVEGSLCKRICTWALLKDKLTGETIIFANTHLDHGTDEVRSQQMTILMDYLADRIGEYPFYLTGDFNCKTDSIPYATATDRLLDSHKTAWTDRSTETRTYHAYQETGGSEIDFIFHNDHTTPVHYEIISKDYNGYVSDHYGVIAEFVN